MGFGEPGKPTRKDHQKSKVELFAGNAQALVELPLWGRILCGPAASLLSKVNTVPFYITNDNGDEIECVLDGSTVMNHRRSDCCIGFFVPPSKKPKATDTGDDDRTDTADATDHTSTADGESVAGSASDAVVATPPLKKGAKKAAKVQPKAQSLVKRQAQEAAKKRKAAMVANLEAASTYKLDFHIQKLNVSHGTQLYVKRRPPWNSFTTVLVCNLVFWFCCFLQCV